MTAPAEPSIRAELRIHTVCLAVLTVVAAGFALSWLQPVMIPFVVAAFLAIALMPLVDWLEVWVRLPRTVAVCMALLLALAALAVLGALTSTAVVQITSSAGQYQKQLDQLELDIKTTLERFGLKSAEPKPPEKDKVGDQKTTEKAPDEAAVERPNLFALIPSGTAQTVLLGATNAVLGIVRQSVLVLVFLFFLLLSSVKRDHPIGGAWGDMEGRIRAYIITMTTLSGVTGVLVGIVLWFFGVQAAVLFGLLTFLFNFIPNVGSFISIVIPIPIICLSQDLTTAEKWMAVLIPAVIQFVIGTFIQPKMMGQSMKLHPVVIVISLIFWGMLWGIVGAFLAVPITSVIRIACDRHPLTRPIANLMAGQLDSFREEPIVLTTESLTNV